MIISTPGSKKAQNRGRSGDVRVPNRPRGPPHRRLAGTLATWSSADDDDVLEAAVRGRVGDITPGWPTLAPTLAPSGDPAGTLATWWPAASSRPSGGDASGPSRIPRPPPGDRSSTGISPNATMAADGDVPVPTARFGKDSGKVRPLLAMHDARNRTSRQEPRFPGNFRGHGSRPGDPFRLECGLSTGRSPATPSSADAGGMNP